MIITSVSVLFFSDLVSLLSSFTRHLISLSFQVGAFGLLIMGIIATHCMLLLVSCARELCRRYIFIANTVYYTFVDWIRGGYFRPKAARMVDVNLSIDLPVVVSR